MEKCGANLWRYKIKFEVIIAKQGSKKGAYIAFPTTRKELWNKLKAVGASRNDWELIGVKTGSNVFGDAVMSCRNLDEMSYLGHCFEKFDSEDEYHFFFELCEAGCAEGQSIDAYITLALNLKNYFRLDGVSCIEDLGECVVKEQLKKHGDDIPEILDIYREDFKNIGNSVAQKFHGNFMNGNFYGCFPSNLRYNGEESEIPDYALIDSLPL